MESIAKKNIRHLSVFDPGPSEQALKEKYSLQTLTRLSMNENVYGCSPRVLQALREVTPQDLAVYPSARTDQLRQALARKHQVDPESIVMTNGLDEMILLLARTFIEEGDEVLGHTPTFPEIYSQARVDGGTPVMIPDKGQNIDWDGMLQGISSRTKMIYLCNPNNPTGRLLPLEEIRDFLEHVPEDVLVVIDEAYMEYTQDPQSSTALPLVEEYPQVAVMRTFSKAYGVANARVGFGVFSPKHLSAIDAVRLPFNFNTLNEKMAIAALKDEDFLEETRKLNEAEKRRWEEFLTTQGLDYHPSATNFLFIHVPRAEALVQKALEAGYRIITHSYEDHVRLTLPAASDGVVLRELFKNHLKN